MLDLKNQKFYFFNSLKILKLFLSKLKKKEEEII